MTYYPGHMTYIVGHTNKSVQEVQAEYLKRGERSLEEQKNAKYNLAGK